jgi:large subunit ribosomal protein L4e
VFAGWLHAGLKGMNKAGGSIGMKIPVYALMGTQKGSITLGRALSRPVRPDVIRRAVLAEQAAMRQPYGTDPEAGKKTSAHYHGRRGIRHSMMNREMARMKRIHGSGYLNMRARFVPQAIKGRKAHPPKAGKVWEMKVNKKERVAALLSAASATLDRDWVLKRGCRIEHIKHIPLVVEDKLQGLTVIKDIRQVLDNLGLLEELERLSEGKSRAGKGTMRGRLHRKRRGMLFIISEDKGLVRAVRNLAGLEVCEVGDLGVEMLAPGAEPGRLCVWTEGALKKMEGLA